MVSRQKQKKINKVTRALRRLSTRIFENDQERNKVRKSLEKELRELKGVGKKMDTMKVLTAPKASKKVKYNPYVGSSDPHARESWTHEGKYYRTTEEDCSCLAFYFNHQKDKQYMCKHMKDAHEEHARELAYELENAVHVLEPCLWCGTDTEGGYCGRACYKADQCATETRFYY